MVTDGPTPTGWRMRITCDRPTCGEVLEIRLPTRSHCSEVPLALGWSLYRHKNLCPRHTRAVKRRLNRDAQKA